jgi:hypothetical protein
MRRQIAAGCQYLPASRRAARTRLVGEFIGPHVPGSDERQDEEDLDNYKRTKTLQEHNFSFFS